MADPYFANVGLLLNFQGANNSTTIIDDSVINCYAYVEGNAKISTTDSDWPTGVLLLDGTGDKVKVQKKPSNEPFQFGAAEDFTIEWFMKTTSAAKIILTTYNGNDGSWLVYLNTSGRLEWRAELPGMDYAQIIVAQPSGAVNTGTKIHCGVSRVEGVVYLVANGVVLASAADETDHSDGPGWDLTVGGEESGTTLDVAGRFGPIRITNGVGRYSGPYTVPTDPFDTEGLPSIECIVNDAGVLRAPSALVLLDTATIADAGVLSAPQAVGHSLHCVAVLPSILSGELVLAHHNFTSQIAPGSQTNYVMDLLTPGGLVRVPISSWQATLQTDVQSYVQCVVPAATAWVPDIEDATEFVVSRVGRLTDGAIIEYEMARAPVQIVSINGGARNYTATISGYIAAITADESPPEALDRTLTGVRTVSRSSGNTRVRCNIDWLLRPGQRAYLDNEHIVVAFINYYVPSLDQYMDVGDRV